MIAYEIQLRCIMKQAGHRPRKNPRKNQAKKKKIQQIFSPDKNLLFQRKIFIPEKKILEEKIVRKILFCFVFCFCFLFLFLFFCLFVFFFFWQIKKTLSEKKFDPDSDQK